MQAQSPQPIADNCWYARMLLVNADASGCVQQQHERQQGRGPGPAAAAVCAQPPLCGQLPPEVGQLEVGEGFPRQGGRLVNLGVYGHECGQNDSACGSSKLGPCSQKLFSLDHPCMPNPKQGQQGQQDGNSFATKL